MPYSIKRSAIPLTAYFPDCILPDCPQKGTEHQHILPHQQQIIDCNTMYLYCQGGVGSAKSLAFAVKCVKLCLEIPENVGVVGRRDFKLLYRSSWYEIKQCIKRLVQRDYLDEYWHLKECYSKKDQGDFSIITFPNGSTLYAVQTKNFSESLGSSYGFAWIDDAMETPEEFFIGDNTTGGLISRIRLPHIRFDSRSYDKETHHHGSLHCMVSSNPPPYGHWLHHLFGSTPGIHKLGDDEVTWMLTSTTDNPFTGVSYAKGLVAVQHQMGHSEGTVRRVIFGESQPAYKGVPVFPQFDAKHHVAPLKFRSDLPLIRSWDFGYAHPAVVFSNLYKCKYNTNHFFTLSEVTDAFDLNIYRFYDKYILPHTTQLYSNASLIRDCGDRSGYRASSSNKDNRSDMKILIDEYHLAFTWRFTALAPSLQYMRGLLDPKTPCRCDLPLVLISNKCPVLIAALSGGYHYPKSRNKPAGEKPVEDKLFADTACAWRYGAENYVKWGLDYREQQALRQQRPLNNTNSLAWLEETDAAFLNRIQSDLTFSQNKAYTSSDLLSFTR